MTSLDKIIATAKEHGWTHDDQGRYAGLNDRTFERPNVTDPSEIEFVYLACSVTGAVLYASWAPGRDGVNGRHVRKGARAFVLHYLTRTGVEPTTKPESPR
jgi:hypothetical protein